jgi:hypothetical protein
VWNYPETGKKGLTRLLTPTAFDPNTGLVAPCVVVLEVDDTADHQIVGKTMSNVTPVLTWAYDRAYTDAGFDVCQAMDARIYTLLHLTQITGACQIIYKSRIKNRREADMKDAGYWRSTFDVYSYSP